MQKSEIEPGLYISSVQSVIYHYATMLPFTLYL